MGMNYQYVVYIWLLFFSAVITAFLGGIVYLWRKEAREAIFFVLSMVVLTIWSLTNAFEMMSTTMNIKLFWANVQYIAYCYSPVTLVLLCMEFTGYNKWIRSRKFIWLFLLPTVINLLVWTNPYHELMRYNISMDQGAWFPIIKKEYGIAFYVHGLYSHILNITAVAILSRAMVKRHLVYRKQVITLMIGAGLIIGPNMMYVLGMSIFPMDITPIFFGPAGIIVLWAIFRYKLFELIPLARAKIIETMDIGIMVIDLENKVQDMNPAFMKLIQSPRNKYIDYDVEDVCSQIPALLQVIYQGEATHQEFTLHKEECSQTYEILITPLINKKNKAIAKLVMVYEITERKKIQQAYMKQQWIMTGIKEKERMARDLHDSLGQLLAFINIQSQGIRQELENNKISIVNTQLDKLTQVSQMAHSELRGYISDVRRRIASADDFVQVFLAYIQLFEKRTEIKVTLDYSCDLAGKSLSPNVWMNILNIMKEALNNIDKHACARVVVITMKQDQHYLYLTVKDDGKGMAEVIETENRKGFGLDIMAERAEMIGAKINITSEIDEGTEISLQVPLMEGEI